MFKVIKELKYKIPKDVYLFLKKSLIVFIIWKLSYHIFLFPNRIIDKPLSNSTAKLSSDLYSLLFKNSETYFIEKIDESGISKAIVFINEKRGVGIADSCNGLELHVLFIGFLICFPGTLKRKIFFAIIGIIVIYILNIIRVTFLSHLNLINYKYADFAHHYLFKMVIYSIIFFIWILFTKNTNLISAK